MNKKFSTLLAGAAFLSAVSVNSVYAQGVQDNSLPTEASAYPIVKLAEGTNTGLFQLKIKDSDKVLSMDKDGKLTLVNVTTSSQLANTLWCVTVTSENQGQTHKYDFMNKGTGMMLDITMSDIVGAEESTPVIPTTGGEISGWAFSREINKLEPERPLFSHFSADSIVGFSVKTNDDKVYVQKEGAKKAETAGFAKFTLQAPGQIYLSAEELNTIFGVQKEDAGVKLTFNKDVLGTTLTNPFNANKFLAEESGDTKYLYISDLKKEAYLRVDTAYTNESGTKFLAYNWTKKGKTGEAIDAVRGSKIQDQHKFAFLYSPAYDSLYIYVHSITWNETKANWETLVKKPEATGDNWRVSLQDLIKNQTRILTVDAKEQNTHISFGNMDCNPVASTKTSVADGVYLIKSAKTGKYLAIPLHNDTTWVNNVEKANTAEWASLDLQDANHMPAYQWVVLKKNVTDKNKVSAVDLYNREYNDGTAADATLQLNKNAGATYMYAASFGDSLEFIPVAKEIYTDKYVGYKHLTNDELITNKYTFNYWHPYASDKFIGVKDSTMNVLEGKKAFTLKSSYKEHAYGYNPSEEVSGNADKKITGRIPGLVRPVRTMYIITNGETTFRNHNVAVESKYKLSKYYPNTTNDSVYFKENNHIEGNHYYAILEATSTGAISTHKAGVSDYDASATLKAQVMGETRTSAFAIAPDETPLYRQFNNELLGENVDNSADSLMFKETIRGEYLMDEHNGALLNKDVDYAGIWSEGKADGKLAFRIDTAWLTRGAGKVKPQYLVSAYRELIEGEKIIPCTETGKHITADGQVTEDPYQCVHAVHVKTPAFIYGKYLVNYSDSAAAVAARKEALNPYLFNTKAVSNSSYTRVGFVPAVQYGDTLIVLTGKYKAMTADQLKNEGIESIMAVYKKDYPKFINVLSGDKHKNVTWSFRYVNPDKAALAYVDGKEGENNSFLIESNVYATGTDGDNQYQTIKGDLAKAIAPNEAAAWLKMHNGCLVLTDASSTFGAAKTGGDGALVFNAYSKTEDDDMVTSNDNINNVEGVSVIAGNGTVTVQGAAGKSVVITNILGKVVAETVLTSDNATIAVPAGIVAVAVDGEEAVKVVVK